MTYKKQIMLNIIKEIKYWGLDFVVENYGLRMKDAGHKFLLKYDQIESSFAKAIPAVRECRGLILEKETLRVLSMPFYRFFNMGEHCADQIDYNTASVFKKEDGSLIGYYWDSTLNDWAVQTSGTPDANTPVGDSDITFRNLFLDTAKIDKSKLNKNFGYYFYR